MLLSVYNTQMAPARASSIKRTRNTSLVHRFKVWICQVGAWLNGSPLGGVYRIKQSMSKARQRRLAAQKGNGPVQPGHCLCLDEFELDFQFLLKPPERAAADQARRVSSASARAFG